LAAIRKITVTRYYTDIDSLNDPLVEPVSYDNSKTNASRAKKWWFLAYTLVRNPDLVELRRRGGAEMKNDIVNPDVSQS